MPFGQLDQDQGKRIYEDQNRQSTINQTPRREVLWRYEILSFYHLGALETGDDGNVDVLAGNCVDETLCDGVATDNATYD